jgi:site-specific DNA-methyltransferase (adenine-specific)
VKPAWSIVHGECLPALERLAELPAAVVTDPPYGICHRSLRGGRFGDCAVEGDADTTDRDAVVAWAAAHRIPGLYFGHWTIPRPKGTRLVITWAKGHHSSHRIPGLPWSGATEEIYVVGQGWVGTPRPNVLTVPGLVPNFDIPRERREHPTQKPVELMRILLSTCPSGLILDPFCGAGTTGVACIRDGRPFLGFEKVARFAKIALRRCTEASAQYRMAV